MTFRACREFFTWNINPALPGTVEISTRLCGMTRELCMKRSKASFASLLDLE
jgi:hypothetical protein